MNQLRVGEPFAELNFGTLLIDWNRRSIEIAIRDARGNATRTVHMPF
jgi:hypothetical protein